MNKCIQNAFLIKADGTILNSVHRHDCVTHKIGNDTYLCDGGVDSGYGRYSYPSLEHVEILCLNSEMSLEEIKNKLLWGTRGIDGKQPLKYVKLIDCETDHLQAILDYPAKIRKEFKEIVPKQLKKIKGKKNKERFLIDLVEREKIIYGYDIGPIHKFIIQWILEERKQAEFDKEFEKI